jgi:hypothetical protein
MKELKFCDGSKFVTCTEKPKPFKGFCTADVFTGYGEKAIVYMPFKRWREIRERQKLYANHGQALECGFDYLGAVIKVFDSFE